MDFLPLGSSRVSFIQNDDPSSERNRTVGEGAFIVFLIASVLNYYYGAILDTSGREAPINQCYALFSSGASKLKSLQSATKPLKGVLNPNFRPFSFELKKKLDFLK